MVNGRHDWTALAARAKGRDKADEELQKKLALRQNLGYNATIVWVLEEFLTWSEKNQADGTYYGHKLYLQDFLDQAEVAFIRELKPLHVTKWVDGHKGWGNASKRGAITSLTRALNWAVEQGMIEKNSVAIVKRSPPNRREVLVAEDKAQRERCECLLAFVIIASISTQIVSAVERLVQGRVGKDTLRQSLGHLRERLQWLLDVARPASAGRIRPVLLAIATIQ